MSPLPKEGRRLPRLWIYAAIGAVVGVIAGLTTEPGLVIPFAIFGFAMGMGIYWILRGDGPAEPRTTDTTRGSNGEGEGEDNANLTCTVGGDFPGSTGVYAGDLAVASWFGTLNGSVE